MAKLAGQRAVHEDLPSALELSLVDRRYPAQATTPNWGPSPGSIDPDIEFARRVHAYEDFKPLSDYEPRSDAKPRKEILLLAEAAEKRALRATEGTEAQKARAGRQAYARVMVEERFQAPAPLLPAKFAFGSLKIQSGKKEIDDGFLVAESIWPTLMKKTPPASRGSLLPSPYPVMVPGSRFQETYYWDSYFGNLGLLATGRVAPAKMQVENLLEVLRTHGLVPNGMRDYYLSRSQPPFLSSMVRDVYDATPASALRERWLRERAYPLLKRDYDQFWMRSDTRYDPATGLNHHWDAENTLRPERFGADDDAKIGKTFRDTRAAAESGYDFTAAHENEASKVAPVLLNSLLWKTEMDLHWMAVRAGEATEAKRFLAAAKKREAAIRKYLWDEKRGVYYNYHLKERRRIPILAADAFAPSYFGLASPLEAERVRLAALPALERPGGLVASEVKSGMQWDSPYAWAPHQVMAVGALQRQGRADDAKRISENWMKANAKIGRKYKTMMEKIDAELADEPVESGEKYPTQTGFLWTIGAYEWLAVKGLGLKPVKAAP